MPIPAPISGKQAAKSKSIQPSDKVLPYDKFDTASWSKMDADVKFTGKDIEHGDSLPLNDLYTHLKLDNGELLLDPLRFGMARGTLNSTIRLEGQRTPMRGRADLHARGLQLKALFPSVEAMRNLPVLAIPWRRAIGQQQWQSTSVDERWYYQP